MPLFLGSGSGSASGSGSGSGFGSGSGIFFPFGVSEGDQLVPPALDGTTAPQSKLAVSGITCPFFGVDEAILHVNYVIELHYEAECTNLFL